MLTCEEALERMSQALDGPLPLEERQALEEHLESCPECRAAYEALFQMEDALREIGETPAPAELSARVMEQIQAEAAPAGPLPTGTGPDGGTLPGWPPVRSSAWDSGTGPVWGAVRM